MQDKTLTNEQSLRVIEDMLSRTRRAAVVGSGNHNLIWGYTSIIVALSVYFSLPCLQYKAYLLWYLIPPIGGLMEYFNVRHLRKVRLMRTQLNRFIGHVWLVVGGCTWAAAILAFLGTIPIVPLVVILIAIGGAITAIMIRAHFWTLTSIIGMLSGLILLAFPVKGKELLLYFSATMLVMMVIPGHYLNYLSKKKVEHDA